jgi:hypothetical protein
MMNAPFHGKPVDYITGVPGAGNTDEAASSITSAAQRPDRRAEMSLPVRIMAVKAGQPQWTMEEAE